MLTESAPCSSTIVLTEFSFRAGSARLSFVAMPLPESADIAGLSLAVLLRVAAADTWLLKLEKAESANMLDLLAWLWEFSLC